MIQAQNEILNIAEGLTKSQINEMAVSVVNNTLEDGNVIQVAEALKALEEFISSVKKDARFVDYCREELAKNAGKVSTASGAKIEACEVGTSYDYSGCGDAEYADMIQGKAGLDARIKEREAFLKTIPASGMDIRYGDELITVFPPVKKSTSSYKITLGK